MIKLKKRRKIAYTRYPGKVYELYDNLLKEPHILIAGTTGAGKTVILNGLIYTALHYTPEEKQLVLIDPKRVSLKKFETAPHVLRRVTEMHDIINTLAYCIDIMETRYQYMEKHNIELYPGSDIYIMIDEYADIALLAKKETEKNIIRLAALARAAAMHLIICTQRPTSDIITGVLKTNIDTRLALRVPRSQDSRNMINFNGAETLPRYGYGYLLTPAENTPILYKLPMISAPDISQVLAYWKR